jgi:DNA-binding protein YbaB
VDVTTDHRAQVEELLADYRRGREQLAAVQRGLAAVSGSATSPDGTVTATVGPQGALTGLVLNENAYRRHRPDQLAELVVRTASEAAAKAAESAYRTLAPVLPAATDPAAVLRGTADLRPEEIAPPQVPRPVRRPVVDDDEDFEQRDSWLDAEVDRRRSR